MTSPTEDHYEFDLVVHRLVRLRHHQGYSAVAKAVWEAAGLEWRFCETCGSETPWDGELCAGCGGNADGGAAQEPKAVMDGLTEAWPAKEL